MAILDGFFGGHLYNKDTKVWEYKTIPSKKGDGSGMIICGLNVSDKNKETGETTYGSRIKVKIIIKSGAEVKQVKELLDGGSLLEAEGSFKPDNYTNQEGKVIQGHIFTVFRASDLRPKAIGSKPKPIVVAEQEDIWE